MISITLRFCLFFVSASDMPRYLMSHLGTPPDTFVKIRTALVDWHRCVSGPFSPTPWCGCMDRLDADFDSDVDLMDYGMLLNRASEQLLGPPWFKL